MSTLTLQNIIIKSASLGVPSPLPDLWAAGDTHSKINYDPNTISADEAKYMGWGNVNGILPYTLQNNYNRSKKDKAWKAAVLENEYLKATFLPQLGGRLWSLYDKKANKELLSVNPVFQPCNLALRNAWISGGVEWNLGIIGHTPFTVSPLFCQFAGTDNNRPLLRMYQFERVRGLVYRVEAMLESDRLFVRVKIDNAKNKDTAVYWWSNIAVEESEKNRIIVPADKAFCFGYGAGVSKVSIPDHMTWDVSRPTSIPHAIDYFFDIEKPRRPFISSISDNGYGFIQTSTKELMGRKLFVWGMGPGGRRWQEFLADEHTAYAEIQCGLAHTQLEHLPFGKNESVEWIEAYGAIHTDPNKTQGASWATAYTEVESRLDAALPYDKLEEMREKFHKYDGVSGTLVNNADGWARLESELNSFNGFGLDFKRGKIGKDELPWLTLLKTGVMPEASPLAPVTGYQISNEWLALLKNSLTKGGDHWLTHYHLGVIYAYKNQINKAKQEFTASIKKSPSPWAYRCLSVLSVKENEPHKAAEYMKKATSMLTQRNLAIEAMDVFIKAERYDYVEELYKGLPKGVKSLGRVKLLLAKSFIESGKLKRAESILIKCPTVFDMREGEVSLSTLWFQLQEKLGTNKPLPQKMDFRMK